MQCTQDRLRNLTNCPLLIATHSDFHASTLKMQDEARNHEERRIGALHAQLRAQCAQDRLRNLRNCPLLIVTHSDFHASTIQNARGSQKLQKEARKLLCAQLCTLVARVRQITKSFHITSKSNCFCLKGYCEPKKTDLKSH